jgi:hypothetical protein
MMTRDPSLQIDVDVPMEKARSWVGRFPSPSFSMPAKEADLHQQRLPLCFHLQGSNYRLMILGIEDTEKTPTGNDANKRATRGIANGDDYESKQLHDYRSPSSPQC